MVCSVPSTNINNSVDHSKCHFIFKYKPLIVNLLPIICINYNLRSFNKSLRNGFSGGFIDDAACSTAGALFSLFVICRFSSSIRLKLESKSNWYVISDSDSSAFDLPKKMIISQKCSQKSRVKTKFSKIRTCNSTNDVETLQYPAYFVDRCPFGHLLTTFCGRLFYSRVSTQKMRK